jgi:protein SCO1/2
LQTSAQALLIFFLSFGFVGCGFWKGDSFESKIRQEKARGLDEVNDSGEGLPFFRSGSLNPTWSKTDALVELTDPMSFLDQDGHPRNENMFKNKVSVLAFFFTSCTGFCPVLMDSLKEVEKKIGPQPGLQLVALSVDPAVDHPAQLKRYALRRHMDTKNSWVLLTGKKELVYSIARATLSSEAFQKQNRPGRDFIHSENFYIFDGKARLRGVLRGTKVDTQEKAQELTMELLSQLKS